MYVTYLPKLIPINFLIKFGEMSSGTGETAKHFIASSKHGKLVCVNGRMVLNELIVIILQ